MTRKNLIRLGIVGATALVTLTLALVLYNVLVFRVTTTTPDPKQFPTVAPYIDIYFSKPVKQVSSFTFNGEKGNGSIAILDNRLRFTSRSTYAIDQQYNLVLQGITSTSGDKLDYTYAFTAVYMNFNDVPEAIRKAAIDKSSSHQIDDPFFNNYFPMQTPDFQIERPRNHEEPEKVLYVTFLREVYNYDTNTKTVLPDSEAEALRVKVLDYIKSRGGTPDKYHISYSNEYLTEKYGSGSNKH